MRLWLRNSTVTALLAGCCTFAIAAGSGPESGKDKQTVWPQWRGGNQDGKSPASGVFKFDQGHGLKLAWKKPLGSGYSSVSIADGRAITMFSDSTYDFLIALDARSGTEQWRYKIDSTYIGRGGGHNGPRSTPVIDDDKIFGLGAAGQLFALDSKTGKQLWATHIIDKYGAIPPFHGFTTSPFVYGNVLVVETGGSQQNTISGFDKNTGKLLWAAGSDSVNYQSPIAASIAGEQQLLCSGDRFVTALNPATGGRLWEFNHNGGNNSLNPVVLADNRIMINHSGREAMLLEINKQNGMFQVAEGWKSREIKQTFNTSIYHEGHIYGYSGRFLTCVDAKTGEKVWRSRPPGDGWLILVDGHLVVMTKSGELHIIEATPDGYDEKANLKVFDDLTYTPPSFAEGRIYGRSITEIASIEVAPVAQLLTLSAPEPEAVAPTSRFATFVSTVESSDNKSARIDEFMEKQKQFPVIERDRLAHFVYRGEAEDMAMIGDMFDWGQQVVLNRIEGTDFYYKSVELEPDAHLSYAFLKDFDNRIPDPLNPQQSPSSFFGQISEVAMPKYVAPKHLEEPVGERGTLVTIEFQSEILKNSREVQVYLPHGYANGKGRYPTIYVNYGKQAVDMAKMPNTLDNLIGKTISPVIAVFIDAPNSFNEYARNLRDQYAQLLADELVPHIDQQYRTVAKPEARALIGADEGGFSAFYAAFKHPGVFGKIGGQSSHLHPPEGDELRALIAGSDKLPLSIYMDWGKYDHRNAAAGFNWAENNRKFAAALKEKGYTIAGGEVSGGFDWPSWRTRTDKILETFFPLKGGTN